MRINIIPVEELSDQHLIAEYNEIKFSTFYYRRSKGTKKGIDKSRISKLYTLNKGHAYMWYDKFSYIERRMEELVIEMKNRGYKVNYPKLDMMGIDEEWNYGDFKPTKECIKINVERIVQRIEKKITQDLKPTFYTMNRRVLSLEEWKERYSKYLKQDSQTSEVN